MEPGSAFLSQSLDWPLRPPELLEALWSINNQQCNENDIDVKAYPQFHKNYCNHAFHDAGRHIAAKTHGSILKVVEDIDGDFSRDEIKTRLRSRIPGPYPELSDEMLESSINLAARLRSMMNIGGLKYGFSGRKGLPWKEGTLRDFLNEYLNVPPRLGSKVKLQKVFNARNLIRIAGIKIEWTNNLDDHLLIIDDDDRKVAIFHHASFLRHGERYLYPLGFRPSSI
jgi:hypothetical protein